MHSASLSYHHTYHPATRIKRKKIRRRRRRRAFLLLVLACTAVWCVMSVADNFRTDAALSEAPESLQSLYERNPDAREFVLDYASEHDKTHKIDLSEYAGISEVPLLMQWDERWGYDQYSGNYFGLSGCGPTCMSMVYIYLTGDTEKSPAFMGQFATEHGYATEGDGTAWAFITDGGRELGLDVTEIPLDQQRIDDNLEVGNPIICIMGPGEFTDSGHFIVLTGKENGKYVINDPNSYRNSEKRWDYDTFSGEIRDLWVMRSL